MINHSAANYLNGKYCCLYHEFRQCCQTVRGSHVIYLLYVCTKTKTLIKTSVQAFANALVRLPERLCTFIIQTKYIWDQSIPGKRIPETKINCPSIVRQFCLVSEQNSLMATMVCRAHEVLLQRKLTYSSDMYALGILMWELWHGDQWFGIYATYRHLHKLTYQQMKGFVPRCHSTCPKEYADIVESCFLEEPTQRPRPQDVIHMLEDCIAARVSEGSAHGQQ